RMYCMRSSTTSALAGVHRPFGPRPVQRCWPAPPRSVYICAPMRRRRTRRGWAMMAIAGGALLGRGSGRAAPAPSGSVEAFVTACKANAPESVCRCAIDNIQKRFSLDQYLAFEKRIAQNDTPKELVDATAECRGR